LNSSTEIPFYFCFVNWISFNGRKGDGGARGNGWPYAFYLIPTAEKETQVAAKETQAAAKKNF
jgi:hypothetical protein